MKTSNRRTGITNAQASYLAHLQRELGRKYSGWGLSRAEASIAIREAIEELEERRQVAARAASEAPATVSG